MSFELLRCLVTVRNEVAKVMFLQACVCPQGGACSGGSAPGGCVCSGECLLPGGVCSQGLSAIWGAAPGGVSTPGESALH